MALPITVQWNTHKESGGVPVFGLNTKQKFAPQPLDNVLDQGQFDNINPNKFRGQRTHGQLNFRQDASEQWANNISWAGAGSPPQATYQGANVNFSQPTNEQFLGLVQETGRINQSLLQYPQQSKLASAKSDSDIWKWIGQNITGKSSSQSGGNEHYSWGSNSNAIVPNIEKNTNAIQQLYSEIKKIISKGTGGMTQQQIEQIIENYHGDDIELLHNNAISLGNAQVKAKDQRDSNTQKIQSNKDEHSIFHTKLTSLGDSQTAAKTHRDSLESKIETHSHNGGGGTCDCNFWDIPCQMGCGIEKIIPYALIGGVALLALRKK